MGSIANRNIFWVYLSILLANQISNHFSDIILLLNFALPGLLVVFLRYNEAGFIMKQLRIIFVMLICVLYFASSSVIDTDSQVGRGKMSVNIMHVENMLSKKREML